MQVKPFVSECCEGERCYCGAPAEHKVEEVIFDDDPIQPRHPLTSYICHAHFREIMGRMADLFPGRADRPKTSEAADGCD
jgi:hypothetical protein